MQKKQKAKQTKKQKNVAVRIGRFFHFFFALFSHFFRFIFVFFRFFFAFFLGGYSKNIFVAFFHFFFALFSFFFFRFIFVFLFFLHCFCFLLCFCIFICFYFVFFHFFHKKNYLMVGHVWLPSPNISYAEVVVVVATPPVPVPRGP